MSQMISSSGTFNIANMRGAREFSFGDDNPPGSDIMVPILGCPVTYAVEWHFCWLKTKRKAEDEKSNDSDSQERPRILGPPPM